MAVTRGQSNGEAANGDASKAEEAPADASSQPASSGLHQTPHSDAAGGAAGESSGDKEPAKWKVALVIFCCVASILAGVFGLIWLTKASDDAVCRSGPPYQGNAQRGWFGACKWDAASDPDYDPRSTWFSRRICGAAQWVSSWEEPAPAFDQGSLSSRLTEESPAPSAGGRGGEEALGARAAVRLGAAAGAAPPGAGVQGCHSKGRHVPAVAASRRAVAGGEPDVFPVVVVLPGAPSRAPRSPAGGRPERAPAAAGALFVPLCSSVDGKGARRRESERPTLRLRSTLRRALS